jgi:hypothetical protein
MTIVCLCRSNRWRAGRTLPLHCCKGEQRCTRGGRIAMDSFVSGTPTTFQRRNALHRFLECMLAPPHSTATFLKPRTDNEFL